MPAHRSQLVSAAAGDALAASLAELRHTLGTPEEFSAEVLDEASTVARDVPTDPSAADVADLREIAFLTVDPAGSLDLDQAMHVARTPTGAVLHYAIADVPVYVLPGGAIDAEARRRGQTLYGADGRIPLHPARLSEDAASLVPGEDRRALVWRFELDEGARPVATTLARAVVRSRRKWSYVEAQRALEAGSAPETLEMLAWFGPLRVERERERGGASLNMPETSIALEHGRYRLERDASLPIEEWNAQVSLMTGMAAADIMLRGGIGILRTVPPADPADVAMFRARTVALGLPWQEGVEYGEYLRTLGHDEPAMSAVREAAASLFRGASYAAFDGAPPAETTQAAIGAPYAHTTAPLRRLVDRWSLVVCEALANGRSVPEWARASLPELPALMARSDQRARQFEAATLDRVEAAVLHGQEGTVFEAVVLSTASSTARVQLIDPPVSAKVASVDAAAGTVIRLRLDSADIATGASVFTPLRVDADRFAPTAPIS